MKWNFQKVQSAQEFATGTSRGGKAVQSVTITYTETNGKRLTLSKAIIANLDLSDTVYIGVLVEVRKLIISKNEITNMDKYKIGKDGNIYSAGLVEGIIAAFGLQPMYDGHTSHTFKDIEVDADNGIAVVTVPVIEDK